MVDAEIQELVKPEGMPPLQWEWWKEWWAQDYSWNSERFKPYREVISNSYNASAPIVALESELKSQRQLIESPDGLLFHICWLPPYWRDGTESEFYRDPKSVRNRATNAFVTYFKEHSGTYAGLTSTFALMQTHLSHGVPISLAEKSFMGGPFLRVRVGGGHVVQLRNCLFSFDQQEDSNSFAVDWNVMLYRSTFSTPRSSAPALNFSYINFLSSFNLSDCNIEESTRFLNCSFTGNFFLGESKNSNFQRIFDGSILFVDCTFNGQVNANQTEQYKGINFNNCTFRNRFGASTLRVHRGISSVLSFSRSVFEDKVIISSDNLIEVVPAFADTTLQKGIDFGPFKAVIDEKFFKRLRGNILEEMASWPAFSAEKNINLSDLQVHEDAELSRMISGVRVVRLASQSRGDKLSEAHLHALELAAYQRLSTTNGASRTFARLYGLLSDYGCSLSKPIAWGGLLFLVSAFLYVLLNEMSQSTSYLQHVDWPQVFHQLSRRDFSIVPESLRHVDFCEIGQAFLYSLSRIIPVGPWQDLVFTDSILSTGKGASISPSSWQKIVVVIVATLQSLFSAIFIFLFGLAARRKFQVG